MAVYKDLNFLFQKHPLSADIVKNTDEAAIKASVLNLLSTKNYERPFHPEIGCQIWSLLFENFSPVVTSIAIQTIKDVIDKYESRVTFKEAKIRERDDSNEIEVEVHVVINSTDRLIRITTALTRVR